MGLGSDGRNAAFGKGICAALAGHVAPYGAAPIRVVYNAFPLSAGSDRVDRGRYREAVRGARRRPAREHHARQDGGVDVDYSADPGRGWTGTVIGGVAIINNGVDAPQAYAAAPGAQRICRTGRRRGARARFARIGTCWWP